MALVLIMPFALSDSEMTSMKTCSKCGEAKPASQFGKRASNSDGLHRYCKACASATYAAWYATNSDKVKARAAAWDAAHPDRVKARSAKWRATNPDNKKAHNRKWSSENPEAGRIYNQNRRARKREAGGKLSNGLSGKLFTLQRGMCACGCGQPLGDDYHMDHQMPLALGGTNTDDNMQLLRSICNRQKHAKHPVEFMQSRGFLL